MSSRIKGVRDSKALSSGNASQPRARAVADRMADPAKGFVACLRDFLMSAQNALKVCLPFELAHTFDSSTERELEKNNIKKKSQKAVFQSRSSLNNSSRMNNTPPYLKKPWTEEGIFRWSGFALGVFTTMAISTEKRSEDEALDEVQESLDNYLIGAPSCTATSSFLRARR